jgi:hypothetical protein
MDVRDLMELRDPFSQLSETQRERLRHREQSRRDLYFALRSRVLTEEEMGRVAALGVHLVLDPFEVHTDLDKQKELNAALLQQFQLRAIAAKAKGFI